MAFMFLIASCHLWAQDISETELDFIDHYLESKEQEYSVSEYREARSYTRGSILKHDSNDLALLYTLEAFNQGNNYYFFLAVFTEQDGKLQLVDDQIVGGKGSRSLALDSIENGVIKFTTRFSVLSDPTCCSSGEGLAFYVVRKEFRSEKMSLKELNMAPEMPKIYPEIEE